MKIVSFTNFPHPVCVLQENNVVVTYLSASEGTTDVSLPQLIEQALRIQNPDYFLYPEEVGTFTTIRMLRSFSDGLCLAGKKCFSVNWATFFPSYQKLWVFESYAYCPSKNQRIALEEMGKYQENGYSIINIDQHNAEIMHCMERLCSYRLPTSYLG